MIRMAAFQGEIPRAAPRLLADNAAQVAVNLKLESGALVPIREPAVVQAVPAGTQTIYRYGGEWLSWAARVSVVPAPIAEDRLYIAGDGPPRIRYGGTEYDLKVPRPATAPVATLGSGTVDPDLQATHIYVYTYVTPLDEESEPSDPSNEVTRSPGIDVDLTGIAPPPAGRPIDRVRIYRSQTSAIGETTLFFVAEVAAGTTAATDDPEANPIQEPLPSADYNPPPDDLRGIITLPNGMMAAFAGKRLYFSEPYRPHAWPEKYVLTCDYEIVALGAFGSTIAVMTVGVPYVVQGTSPDGMAMEKTELNLPCINALGVVDMGYSILYPSTRGLVMVSSGGAQLATEGLFTRDQWLAMSPETFIADQWDGRYLATYTYDNGETEISATLVVNISGQQAAFISRSGIVATALFNEIGTGQLFMLVDDIIYEWDAPDEDPAEYRWRSKVHVLPGQTNFGALLVEGDGAVLVPSIGPAVTVYADGQEVATTTALNRPVRLPSGFLASAWEVEALGKIPITSISLAASPSELADV